MTVLLGTSPGIFAPRWGYLLVAVFLALASGPTGAGSWTGTLQDGTVLKVDPGSHRAIRFYNGGVAPLWDGAHRLEDGSVIIVRDGQAVPTESMMNSWTGEPEPDPGLGARYCDQLVRKVCGFGDECSRARPCVLARQLLGMEREQQRRAPVGAGPRPRTPSGGECQGALSSPAFPVCTTSVAPARQTACKKLVDRVCGGADECDAATACSPARQLLQMESEERLQSADSDAGTPTGAECEKAMTNAFFERCQ